MKNLKRLVAVVSSLLLVAFVLIGVLDLEISSVHKNLAWATGSTMLLTWISLVSMGKWKDDIPNYHEWFWTTRSIGMKLATRLGIFMLYLYSVLIHHLHHELLMSWTDIVFAGFPVVGFGVAILLQPYLIYKGLVRRGWFTEPGNVFHAAVLNKDRNIYDNLYWYNNTENHKKYNKMSFNVVGEENDSVKVNTKSLDTGSDYSWIKRKDCSFILKIKKQ